MAFLINVVFINVVCLNSLLSRNTAPDNLEKRKRDHIQYSFARNTAKQEDNNYASTIKYYCVIIFKKAVGISLINMQEVNSH